MKLVVEKVRNYVVIIVALTEYFIIRLSVVRTEHHAYQWQVQLVSSTEVLTADSEVVRCCGRWHDIY